MDGDIQNLTIHAGSGYGISRLHDLSALFTKTAKVSLHKIYSCGIRNPDKGSVHVTVYDII